MTKPGLVILDRDGVINHDSPEYIKSPDEWIPIEGSLEAIALLNGHGFRVWVATNQAGVGRGIFTEETLQAIHRKMAQEVEGVGGKLTGILYCPHHPDDGCDCRKPEPGMLNEILIRERADAPAVPYVGDSRRDILAARGAGCAPVIVLTGNGSMTHSQEPHVVSYDNLLAFARALID